jgi:hypothetical protein
MEAVGAREHAVEDYGGGGFRAGCGAVEEVGLGGVAVGFVMGPVAFCLEVEEEAAGEVLFIFDDDDEGRGWRHGVMR